MKVIIVLASINQETHLRAMSELTVLLSNDNQMEKLKESVSIEEIWNILNK